jgi:hypothetical protein
MGEWIYIPLTSALVGGEWSVSRPGRFTPAERAPDTHWIGSWMEPRASLDDVKKRRFLTLPGLELRPLGRAARSQSQYRLSYPAPDHREWWMKNAVICNLTLSMVQIYRCFRGICCPDLQSLRVSQTDKREQSRDDSCSGWRQGNKKYLTFTNIRLETNPGVTGT